MHRLSDSRARKYRNQAAPCWAVGVRHLGDGDRAGTVFCSEALPVNDAAASCRASRRPCCARFAQRRRHARPAGRSAARRRRPGRWAGEPMPSRQTGAPSCVLAAGAGSAPGRRRAPPRWTSTMPRRRRAAPSALDQRADTWSKPSIALAVDGHDAVARRQHALRGGVGRRPRRPAPAAAQDASARPSRDQHAGARRSRPAAATAAGCAYGVCVQASSTSHAGVVAVERGGGERHAGFVQAVATAPPSTASTRSPACSPAGLRPCRVVPADRG